MGVASSKSFAVKRPSFGSRPSFMKRPSMTALKSSHKKRSHSAPAGPLTFHDVYKLGAEIGTGTWGKVHVGIHRATKDTVAVKIISRQKLDAAESQRLKNEIEVLQTLDHPNIIKLMDVFEEPERYYLVLEICSGGELLDKLAEKRTYTEKEARDLVTILLEAIAYMHERNIVHRDIKPENLLLTNSADCSTIKLADFGFAEKVKKDNSLTALLGTPSYIAPEILRGTPYGLKIDCWSIGVIIYILLGGYTPFSGKSHTELFRKIRQAEFEFHQSMWEGISDEAKDLICGLLNPNPEERMTARDALKHRWFRVDSNSLYDRDLNRSLTNLRAFNAKRKFRAAADAVAFIKKMERSMSRGQSIAQSVGGSSTDSERYDERDGQLAVGEVTVDCAEERIAEMVGDRQ